VSQHSVIVIGIGDDGPAGLSAEAHAHIASARVLAGGRRHLEFFPEWTGTRVVIDSDLSGFVGRLRECSAREGVVVLASGDPLFHGIGSVLLRSFPKECLVFLPHVSAVQLAFARIKESWHDARVVSVHGRPLETLRPSLEEGAAKLAVLTDGNNHPAAIAELLNRLGVAGEYALWVCENLGGPDERVTRHSPAHMARETFSPLNIVVLVRDGSVPGRTLWNAAGGAAPLPILGIPESALQHRPGPRGLITRREVRVMVLCYLELRANDVLWDIGAGSGSVSLEAARLSPGLSVFAVDRDADAYAQLELNVSRLGSGRVRAMRAEAPEGLEGLPEPDAVFIGGSGGRLGDILAVVLRRLKPGGRLVVNCITLETLSCGWEWLRSQALEPEVTSVQLAHSRPLGRLHSLAPDNLIFILRARKP
jgi:precorrin-6Y C5,15-methyltransferase (decarboxylating)